MEPVPEPTRAANDVGNSRKFRITPEARIGTTGAQAHSKTHLDYWKPRIFKPEFKRNGRTHKSANWAVQIRYRKRGVRWSLGTPNREAAAARARDIYLYLLANGWEAAFEKFRPSANAPSKTLTVGAFLAAVQKSSDVEPTTFTGYAQALRKIVADAFGIESTNQRFGPRGGYHEWLAQVNDVKLAELTPAMIQSWKRSYLSRHDDPVSARSAKVSVNSLMRRARSLFSDRMLRHLPVELENPFKHVEFESRPSL